MVEILEKIAVDLVRDYNITEEIVDAFLEDTDFIREIEENIKNVKGSLMNYEDYKYDYINIVIDEIDYQVKKGVK